MQLYTENAELGKWLRTKNVQGQQPIESIVDSILTKYNAKHIITGHSIVADTISVWHHNKVINTDTHHASDKSEALLIEGSKFYRVNDKGLRRLLFDDAL